MHIYIQSICPPVYTCYRPQVFLSEVCRPVGRGRRSVSNPCLRFLLVHQILYHCFHHFSIAVRTSLYSLKILPRRKGFERSFEYRFYKFSINFDRKHLTLDRSQMFVRAIFKAGKVFLSLATLRQTLPFAETSPLRRTMNLHGLNNAVILN